MSEDVQAEQPQTSNIVAMPGCTIPENTNGLPPPNEALIGVLEQLLEQARSGELRNFVGTGFTATGDVISARSDPDPNAYRMVGAIIYLLRRYMEFIDAYNED